MLESFTDSRGIEWNSFEELLEAFAEAAELKKHDECAYLNEAMDLWLGMEYDLRAA